MAWYGDDKFHLSVSGLQRYSHKYEKVPLPVIRFKKGLQVSILLIQIKIMFIHGKLNVNQANTAATAYLKIVISVNGRLAR
jgi:hypothetical protein